MGVESEYLSAVSSDVDVQQQRNGCKGTRLKNDCAVLCCAAVSRSTQGDASGSTMGRSQVVHGAQGGAQVCTAAEMHMLVCLCILFSNCTAHALTQRRLHTAQIGTAAADAYVCIGFCGFVQQSLCGCTLDQGAWIVEQP